MQVTIIANTVIVCFFLWIALPVYLLTGSRQCSCEKVNGTNGEFFAPINKLYVELFNKSQDGAISLLMIAIASIGVAINVLCSIPLFHFILRDRSFKLYARLWKNAQYEEMPNFFFKV